MKLLNFDVSWPSFQPFAVPPVDINIVTNIRPTNNSSMERSVTVYVSQHPGHNWYHLQAAKETKHAHHTETNKKWHPTPDPSRTGCPQKHVCPSLLVHAGLYIVQICHQNPLGHLRVLKSQDWTQHTSLVIKITHKKIIGFKSRMQVYMPCIKISKPSEHHPGWWMQNVQSGSKYSSSHMSSWAVACHPCRLPLYLLQGIFSVQLSVTAMVQEDLLIACFYLFQLPHITRGLLPYWLVLHSSLCPIWLSHTTPLNTLHIARSIKGPHITIQIHPQLTRVVCLLFVSLALQHSAGYGLLFHEVSWSHTATHHSW
jgi:hypothetical protein